MTIADELRHLLNSVPVGLGIADLSGNLLECNDALLALSGYDWADFQEVGNVAALYDDLTQRQDVLAAFGRQGLVKKYPVRFKRKDGSAFDALLSLTPATFSGQACVMALVEDITERERAAEALREMADLLSESQRVAHIGGWVWRLTGSITWTAETYRIYGVSPETFTPTVESLVALVHPEDRLAMQRWIEACATGQSPDELEFRAVRPDGTVRLLAGCGEWVAETADRRGHIIGTVRDITERKRAEVALRESEERYRRLSNTMPDALLVGQDGTIVYANPAAARLLRATAPEALVGLVMVAIVEPAQRELAVERKRDTLAGEQEPRFEDCLSRFDGSSVQVELSASVTEWEGRPALQVVARDITERKQAEKEAAALSAQLQQVEKMESVGRLAGGVAHEFNNMLGVIMGHAELALEQVDPALPLHADLQDIRSAATRSADLTRQLLAFARKQTVMPRELDVNDTVASMLRMLTRVIGESIDLQWKPGANLWSVKMDPSQLAQILTNLCVNARDAISGVGTLTIETGNSTLDEHDCTAHPGRIPGQYVRLAVSDDGCGMDEETLPLLFEPFFTTKEFGRGRGLGLASVYGAITQGGGFIDVASEPNHGSTFTVYLPRHVGNVAQALTERAATPVPRGHKTILLVEDEPSILTMTRKMLEYQGYAVLAASTPGKAITLAEEHAGEIHLLMTDVVMPEMNGRVLAKNLLAHYPQLKRLFMSGYTADVIAHHCALDEGVPFIQKPFTMEALATKVRDALDAPS